jgi:hypothetical protein
MLSLPALKENNIAGHYDFFLSAARLNIIFFGSFYQKRTLAFLRLSPLLRRQLRA